MAFLSSLFLVFFWHDKYLKILRTKRNFSMNWNFLLFLKGLSLKQMTTASSEVKSPTWEYVLSSGNPIQITVFFFKNVVILQCTDPNYLTLKIATYPNPFRPHLFSVRADLVGFRLPQPIFLDRGYSRNRKFGTVLVYNESFWKSIPISSLFPNILLTSVFFVQKLRFYILFAQSHNRW